MARCRDPITDERYFCGYSRFRSWGRWVVLASVLFAFFFLVLLAYISARRRRAMGYQPFKGTAWMLGRNQQTAFTQQQQEDGYVLTQNRNYSQAEWNQEPPPYQQPAYGHDTIETGVYQPPTAPPPVAKEGYGWKQ